MCEELFCPQCSKNCVYTESDDESLFEISCEYCSFNGVIIPNIKIQDLKEIPNAKEEHLDDDFVIEFEPDFNLDDNDDEN